MEIVYLLGLALIGWVVIEAAMGAILSVTRSIKRAKRQALQADQLNRELAEASTEYSTKDSDRWKGFRRFSVVNKVLEAEDICSFYLSPVDGGSVSAFESGQHIGFRFTIPGDSKPTIRSYSLSSGAIDDKTYRVTVKKVPAPPGTDFPPGKGSKYFHEELNAGSIIEVSAPNGKFLLDREDRRPAVLLAGGIGITPLLSMLETMSSEGSDRVCHLFHAVRSHRDHAFANRLIELDRSMENLHLHTFFSSPEAGSVPEGVHTGFLSVDVIRETVGTLDAQIYICGPPPMMQALVPALEDAGVPAEDLKMEAFGPASVKKKKSSQALKSKEGSRSGPVIKYGSSNMEVQWDGESSILEMAEENDVDIDSSCRAGSCGTCQVRLLSGKVKYEDKPAFDPEEGHCLTCISIPDGDVELDA